MITARMLTVIVILFAAANCAKALTVEEYRDANAQLLARLVTGAVVYTEESSGEKLPDSVRADLRADPAEEDGQSLKIAEANMAIQKTRVRVAFRSTPAQWKVQTTDLRDLNEIMSDRDIEGSRRRLLDLSRVSIVSEGIHAELDSGTRVLRVRRVPAPAANAKVSVLSSPIRFGFLMDSVFEQYDAHSVDSVVVEGRNLYRITLRSSRGRVVVEVDPELDYCYRRIHIYGPEDRIRVSAEAREFRRVNGVVFPHKYERTNYRADGSPSKNTKFIVESADFNRPLQDADLEVVLPEKVVAISSDDSVLGVDLSRTAGKLSAEALPGILIRPRLPR